MQKQISHNALILLLIFVTLLWGVSWVCAKYLATQMQLAPLTFWRFVVTAVFAYVSLRFFAKTSLRVPQKSWIWLLGGGVFMGASQFANFAGLEVGYAGLASIIFNATSPIFTFLMAAFIYKKRISSFDATALFLGAVGAAVIFEFWNLDAAKIIAGGNLFFIFNAICFAAVTLCSQKASVYANAASFTVYMSVVGALMSLPFCEPSGLLSLFDKSGIFWANLLFMAGIAGGFGTTAYFFAVGRLGSAHSSSFIFLVPISSVVAANIAFGELTALSELAGGALSLVAVYMLNARKRA